MHSYVGPKHLHSHLCQDGALRASVGPCQYHRGTSFSGGVTEKKEEELPPGSDHSSGSAWGGGGLCGRAGEDPTPTPVLLRGSSACRQFGRRDGGGSQPISISYQSPLPEEELALQEGKGRTCPTLSSSTVPLHDDSFHDSSP